MQLFFLGTSAGTVTAERNMSALILDLIQERNRLWLFDCGEGTQHRMLNAKLKLAKLEKIFITHLHGDHLFGLPGVLTTRSMMQNMSPMTVYGPKGIRRFIDTVIDLSSSFLSYPLDIIEIEAPMILFEDHQFTISCESLIHRVPCFGYRIVEKDCAIKLDINSLKKQNIDFSPYYGKLKLGQTVELDDGRVIDGKRYWLDVKKGRKVAILGDTIPCNGAITLAKDVDVLVHEATQKHDLVTKANERGHSTTVQAAYIAQQSDAKQLIITHISPRYSLSDSDAIIAECRQVFPNSEIARDFYQVDIR